MSLDTEAEPVTTRPAGLTTIEPATFRGVDCTVLAERYAAYRRDRSLDQAMVIPDLIVTQAPATDAH